MSAAVASERWGFDSSYVRQLYRKYPNRFLDGTIRQFGKTYVITKEGMEYLTGQGELEAKNSRNTLKGTKKIINILSFKGGVGKTTTAKIINEALYKAGKNSLYVDLDYEDFPAKIESDYVILDQSPYVKQDESLYLDKSDFIIFPYAENISNIKILSLMKEVILRAKVHNESLQVIFVKTGLEKNNNFDKETKSLKKQVPIIFADFSVDNSEELTNINDQIKNERSEEIEKIIKNILGT
ncbi:helix-turn-helix domain-containing protein [Listeria monocytogenes]|nr:helix-turn-helix domain-containing protein [Listeria monocytogenes]